MVRGRPLWRSAGHARGDALDGRPSHSLGSNRPRRRTSRRLSSLYERSTHCVGMTIGSTLIIPAGNPTKRQTPAFQHGFSRSPTHSNGDTSLKNESQRSIVSGSGTNQGRTVQPERIQIDRFIVRGACLPAAV